ncbi:MAG: SMI1/KNR4 family protein [Alphaproteobacteria bacterium]|nr:SMI1/KNR4 family protein [Alphaproteobacteria bacterium]
MPTFDLQRLPPPLLSFVEGLVAEPFPGGLLLRSDRSSLLFEPVDDERIDAYEQRHGVIVPRRYRDFLRSTNGATILDLALFGLPPSMQQDPPQLSREGFQPLDLATATRFWRTAYEAAPDALHIGSCTEGMQGTGQAFADLLADLEDYLE